MRIPGILFGYLFFLLSTAALQAQLKVNGLTRSVFQGQTLEGEGLSGDSLSPRNTQNGYTLIDLRTQYRYRSHRLTLDSRVKNQIGGFGGIGLGMEIRQIQASGEWGKWGKYVLGDVDYRLSPLTFWNAEDPAPGRDNPLFAIRRAVTAYENFNFEETWRMRGGKVEAGWNLGKDLRWNQTLFALSDRDVPSLKTGFPLRWGSVSSLSHPNYGELSLNHLALSDTLGGGSKTQVTGGSGKFWLKKAKGQYKELTQAWEVAGEFQRSQSQRDAEASLRNPDRKDWAYTLRFSWNKKRLGRFSHHLEAGWMETGAFFESPAAQTLRFSPDQASDFLPMLRNNTAFRTPTLLDRIGSERMQNRQVLSYRQRVYAPYSLVLPYGAASPNRRGLTWKTQLGRSTKWTIENKGAALQEILGEGDPSRRSFFMVHTQIVRNIFVWRRTLEPGETQANRLVLSHRYESSSRGGMLPTRVSVHTFEAGLQWDLPRNWEFLTGMMYLRSQGRDWVSVFGTQNEITRYENTDLNLHEWLVGAGFRHSFTPRCMVLVSSYFSQRKGTYTLESGRLLQHYAQFAYAF